MRPIVDTHCHLVYLDRLRYPWLDDVPALNHDFPLDRYLAEATPAGIATVLHMEVDVAEADIAAETELVGGLGLAGLVAACRPEFDGIRGLPRLGRRQSPHQGLPPHSPHPARRSWPQPDIPCESQTYRRGGRPFDLCLLARQLPIGLRIAKGCPDLQFVLDHCGNPDVGTGTLGPWRDDVAALARLPNVACKVSGIIANAGSSAWTVEDLRPYVEHIIDVFGWDRVVWGSDWPVCTLTGDLTRWVAATRALVATASQDEQDRLLSRNAKRIYGLA